jgi:hypothetical protein
VDLSHVVEHKRREAEIETNGFTNLIRKFQPPFQALPSTFSSDSKHLSPPGQSIGGNLFAETKSMAKQMVCRPYG